MRFLCIVVCHFLRTVAGGGDNPFLGFPSTARPAAAAAYGSDTGGRTPSSAIIDPHQTSAPMTANMTSSSSPQNRQQQQQQRNGGRLAEPADGKVRKVSGKLFQDPGSVRWVRGGEGRFRAKGRGSCACSHSQPQECQDPG